MEGGLPPADAVRVEEWINYFPYAYASPEGHDAFRVSTLLTDCPSGKEVEIHTADSAGVAADRAFYVLVN